MNLLFSLQIVALHSLEKCCRLQLAAVITIYFSVPLNGPFHVHFSSLLIRLTTVRHSTGSSSHHSLLDAQITTAFSRIEMVFVSPAVVLLLDKVIAKACSGQYI